MRTKFTKIFAPSVIALSILAVGLVIIPASYSLASAARQLGGGGGANIDLGGGMTRGGGLHVNAGNGAHVGIGDLNLNAGGSQVLPRQANNK